MKTAELSLYIIEDDAYFRETFADVMSLKGVSVSGAGSAVDGLQALHRARPDVIILDVQLPDMHGFELCHVIKHMPAFKNTPVILLTAATSYSDPRDQAEGMLAGASAFLSKPITMERLWEEIEILTR